MESLIALILAVEQDMANHSAQFLPILLECMTNSEWTTRKMAIDVIYSMGAILKSAISPYKQDILDVLAHTKVDKVKQVREASSEAILLLKELGDQSMENRNNDEDSLNIAQHERKIRGRTPDGGASKSSLRDPSPTIVKPSNFEMKKSKSRGIHNSNR